MSDGRWSRYAKVVARAWKVAARAPVPPLALMSLVAAPGVADAQTLGAATKGPGQYDTDSGWQSSGLICAPSAEPTLAVGPVQLSSQAQPTPLLEQAANFNYGGL